MIIYKNTQEHLLEKVFKCLKDHGLSINVSNCTFGQTEVKISEDIITLPLRVNTASNFKEPKTINELQKFFKNDQFLKTIYSKSSSFTRTFL